MTFVINVSTWLGLAAAILTIVQVAADLMQGRARRTPSSDRSYQITQLATAEVCLPGPDVYAWDLRMGFFMAALSPLVGAWGVYTFVTTWTLHLGGMDISVAPSSSRKPSCYL